VEGAIFGRDQLHSLFFGTKVQAQTGGLPEDAALALFLFVWVSHRLHRHDIGELKTFADVPFLDEAVGRNAVERFSLVAFILPLNLPNSVCVR